MERITSASQLRSIREARMKLHTEREAHGVVEIRVALATCGIASGAKEIHDYLVEELQKRNIEALVIRTGCMGYCYAEPTIEVALPGQQPVVFGEVDTTRANLIIEKFIRQGEAVAGIIPLNHERVVIE